MNRALNWLREGDRWIPMIFVAGFLLLFLVNGRMVWLAIATNPGLVTDRPSAAAGPAGAPEVAILFDGEAMRAEPVTVRLVDAAGQTVPARSVVLRAERPTRYAQALVVPLERRGTGWAGEVRLPLGGEWVFTVRAETDEGLLELQQTVEVRPGRVP